MPPELSIEEPLSVAALLANASTQEAFEIFEELREQGRLSAAVRGLNALLDDPAHRSLSLAALRRIGLEFAG